MWYYEISTDLGALLECGYYMDKDEMLRHCKVRMKQLNADICTACYIEE